MDLTTKIDPNLRISMQLSDTELDRDVEASIGYDRTDKTWRLIVKYGGNIEAVVRKYNAVVERLTENYAIITIPEGNILSLSQEREIEYIEKPRGLEYQLNRGLWESCVVQVNDYIPYNLKGEGVLIGIIDSGIDYSHPDFLDEMGKTRILRMWDQSLDGNPPIGYHHGTEYTSNDINNILDNYVNIYISGPLPSIDTSGHGTLVTGVAAGNGAVSNGYFRGVAPKATLAIVKLGPTDYEGYPIKTIDVMLGVKYLIEVARAANMPLAINLSYGSAYGSRDGHGLFETYINEMALHWKTSISTGSGNDAAKKLHTDGNIKNGKEINFIISGYTASISLEIWKSSVDNFNIEIIYPSGTSTGVIPKLNQVLRYRYRSESIIVLSSPPTPFNVNDSINIEIISEDTRLEEGIWTIRLYEQIILSGGYEVWMHSDSSQSCDFLNPTPYNTLTLPSTVENLITVAAYDYRTGKIADFSGRGSAAFQIIKPDISAPGVGITSTDVGGNYEMASGTSMAAPYVTGACALMMQWGIVEKNDPYLYGSKLRAYLYAGTNKDRNIMYPNNIWGYGKLCLQNVMDILMSGNSSRGILRISQTDFEEEDNLTEEEKILSEDYIDMLVEKNSNLASLLSRYKDIILGYDYDINSIIIHVARKIVNDIIGDLTLMSSLSYPFLFGLLDIDSLNASNILSVNYHPTLALRGEGALIGIIDTGMDYTHEAFIDKNGKTRIKSIWDQSIITNNPPTSFKFGTEYTENQINEALNSENPFDVVPSTDDIGHGTFLAGVAGGSNSSRYAGVAPEANFLCVKLTMAKKYAKENSMIFDEDAVAYEATDILMGIRYLTSKARQLNMPISILLGVGTTQGSHIGIAYERLVNNLGGACIVSACGNEGNSMNHAMGNLSHTGDMKILEVNIAEEEKGIQINIWGYVPDKISIGLISPSGEVVERIPVRNTTQGHLKLILYDTSIWVNYFTAVDINGDELIVIRMKNPEPGLWKIQLFGDDIIDGRFHAWLPLRNWVSRDTYFINSNSEYTVTEMGNSFDLISVGSYNYVNQHLSIDSSRGPTRFELIEPDLIAPGVDVAGPMPNNKYGHLSGTSVAAAHVAGAAALLLEWGVVDGNQRDLNTQRIRALLISGARRRKGINYPNNQYGYGELDLLNTFTQMNTNAPIESYGIYLDDI